MEWIRRQFSKELWSPYVAGALLGVVGMLAIALSGNLLGASGGFENLAGLVGKAVAPKAFDNVYFNYVMPAGITWQVILLVGVFFGGMLGGLSAGKLRWSWMPDVQWTKVFGARRVDATELGDIMAIPRRLRRLGMTRWAAATKTAPRGAVWSAQAELVRGSGASGLRPTAG